jgi:hypothetical protein
MNLVSTLEDLPSLFGIVRPAIRFIFSSEEGARAFADCCWGRKNPFVLDAGTDLTRHSTSPLYQP